MNAPWAIFVGGPDEYHAAPSEAAAIHMADKHNAAMRDYVAKSKTDWALDLLEAEPVEWPFDADSHSAELAEFDYAAWGLEGAAVQKAATDAS